MKQLTLYFGVSLALSIIFSKPFQKTNNPNGLSRHKLCATDLTLKVT